MPGAFANLTTEGSKKSRIGIFVPSWAPRESDLTQAITYLNAEGFIVNCPKDLISPPIPGCPWANSKEERARHIINMLNDSHIDAMWAVEGGESAL